MEEINSVGKCYYCKKEIGSGSISRHLGTHLKKIEKETKVKGKAYHVKVVGGEDYFLHLLIRDDITLNTLDSFLREIWLECCGHLSSFEIAGMKRSFQVDLWSDDEEEFGISQNIITGDLFEKGMKLNYQYDFGSTTYLNLTVLNEYQITSERDILLLSRNEPLKMLCDTCQKKPAKVFCQLWHHDETMFCDSCKKNHAKTCEDFEDYSEGTIVNSPRMGICGYEGGTIDVERDGVWKK